MNIYIFYIYILKYIETLKKHKTNGPSSLPNKLFKKFKKCLKIPLAELGNLMIELREFAEILKTARAAPIHKNVNKTDCNNYRPISLTSNWSKILEIMYDKLYSFLEKKNHSMNTNLDLEIIALLHMH